MWFETGSPCLLTLVLPLDRGLAAGIMPKGTNVPSLGGGSVTCWARVPFSAEWALTRMPSRPLPALREREEGSQQEPQS